MGDDEGINFSSVGAFLHFWVESAGKARKRFLGQLTNFPSFAAFSFRFFLTMRTGEGCGVKLLDNENLSREQRGTSWIENEHCKDNLIHESRFLPKTQGFHFFLLVVIQRFRADFCAHAASHLKNEIN